MPAKTYFEELSGPTGALRDLRLGLVHGEMKDEEKEAAMQAFKSGATQARGGHARRCLWGRPAFATRPGRDLAAACVMFFCLLRSPQVLVATKVVEVGMDVPEASIMLVENAERFGAPVPSASASAQSISLRASWSFSRSSAGFWGPIRFAAREWGSVKCARPLEAALKEITPVLSWYSHWSRCPRHRHPASCVCLFKQV